MSRFLDLINGQPVTTSTTAPIETPIEKKAVVEEPKVEPKKPIASKPSTNK
jgi:hypothetical protein